MVMTMKKIRTAILGASGYTGAELLRLLLGHPFVEIAALTAEKNAGQPVAAILPHLAGCDLPDLKKISEVDFAAIDLVFCALPHKTTQEIISALPEHLRIIDLSADFRLKNLQTYQKWYEHAHKAPNLQQNAVYGLTEIFREQITKARLVANPGCYPTASQLPLIPLLKEKLILPHDIIIDAKSGISGAGRELKTGILYCESTEGLKAYGVASHRHAPEIEQGLSEVWGQDVLVTFTPHLTPMSRGIFATIYVKLAEKVTAQILRQLLTEFYHREAFVRILPEGDLPATQYVRGTNFCQISVVEDRLPHRAILLCAIDNLVKGASGQAIQNMNVMYGFTETTNLMQTALFP